MKTLILTRHAKSSWADFSLSDIDRPLNNRGKTDGPIMSKVLRKEGYRIEKIILSPSRRTRDTAKYFRKEFDLPKSAMEIEPSLYHGMENDFLNVLSYQTDDLDTIMMIGHNPGMTYMANSAKGQMIDNVPTTGIVILTSDVESWNDFKLENSSIEKFLYPKMYK